MRHLCGSGPHLFKYARYLPPSRFSRVAQRAQSAARKKIAFTTHTALILAAFFAFCAIAAAWPFSGKNAAAAITRRRNKFSHRTPGCLSKWSCFVRVRARTSVSTHDAAQSAASVSRKRVCRVLEERSTFERFVGIQRRKLFRVG